MLLLANSLVDDSDSLFPEAWCRVVTTHEAVSFRFVDLDRFVQLSLWDARLSVPFESGLLVVFSAFDKRHDLLGKFIDDLDLSSTLSDSKVIDLWENRVSVSQSFMMVTAFLGFGRDAQYFGWDRSTIALDEIGHSILLVENFEV